MGCLSVNHTICLPEVPKVASRVTVPLITQEVEKPDWEPDPLWPAIDFVPDNEFWAIVSDSVSVDASVETYVTLILNDSSAYSLSIDWGDGSSEEVPGNTLAEHVYANGTGTPDSSGNTVWLMKAKIINPPGRGVIVRCCQGVQGKRTRKAAYRYMAFGQLPKGSVLRISNNPANTGFTRLSLLEGLRFFGSDIWEYPQLRNCFNLKSIVFDDGALVHGFSQNGVYGTYVIDLGNFVFADGCLIAESALAGFIGYGSFDFSGCSINGAVNVAQGCSKVEVLVFPASTVVSSLNGVCGNCYNLKGLSLFASSAAKVNNIQGFLQNTYALRVLGLPKDLGGDVQKVQAGNAFSYCGYEGVIDIPNARVDCIHAQYSNISDIVVHPESPLDNGTTPINISYSNFDRNAIVRLFNWIPETDAAKTILITGAKGAADLTDEDKLIATVKGWVIQN